MRNPQQRDTRAIVAFCWVLRPGLMAGRLGQARQYGVFDVFCSDAFITG